MEQQDDQARTEHIVSVLKDAFADLMEAAPGAFRVKFRKMAADPHAFYRGTACLFFSDVTREEDPFSDDRASSIWVHGDLHVENFGTYMNSDGRLVFDVNDFDEAYLGHWTWDLQRFCTSLRLQCWQKALPDEVISSLIRTYVTAYLERVDAYAVTTQDEDFALDLDNTTGVVHAALVAARRRRRADQLDAMTTVRGGQRSFIDEDDPTVRRLPDQERERVLSAYEEYLRSIPEDKRFARDVFYEVHDVVGKSGVGIGSAGLPMYTLLLEGHSQALENDVLLSMKQANVPAVSRYAPQERMQDYFTDEAQRTVVSQRALQVHTDPLLGHATLDGRGFLVSELSPYELDLEWDDIAEPEEMHEIVRLLGQATAKIHCASDEDSDQDLVPFQVEDAIRDCVDGRREELIDWLTERAHTYAMQVRRDHTLFVNAFRNGQAGISAL